MDIGQEIKLECPIHKQRIITCQISEQNSTKWFCLQCLTQQQIPIEQLPLQLNKLIEEKIKVLSEQSHQSQKRLNQLKKMFLLIKDQFFQNINEIISIIDSGAHEMCDQTNHSIEKLASSLRSITITSVEKQLKELAKESKEFEERKYLHFDKIIRIRAMKQYVQLQEKLNKQIKLSSKWNFELKFKKEGIQWCRAIAMNNKENILVNASKNDIQVNTFANDGKFILKQLLKGHKNSTNWFMSGSEDSTLRNWYEQSNGSWSCIQVLEGHKKQIRDIVLDDQENLLLSCSDDSTIRSWVRKIKSYQWELRQILTEHNGSVLFLSLSPDSKQLASRGWDKLRIWQKTNDNSWLQSQLVEDPLNQHFNRICFVDNTSIVTTTIEDGKIFKLVKIQNEFKSGSELILNNKEETDPTVFPIRFNNQAQIMICRHHNQTFVLVRQENNEFLVNQVINGNFRGMCLAPSSQYLVLAEWDRDQLHVFKLQ